MRSKLPHGVDVGLLEVPGEREAGGGERGRDAERKTDRDRQYDAAPGEKELVVLDAAAHRPPLCFGEVAPDVVPGGELLRTVIVLPPVPLLMRVVQQLGRRDSCWPDDSRGAGGAREERKAAHRAVAAALLRGRHDDADLERRLVGTVGKRAEPRNLAG